MKALSAWELKKLDALATSRYGIPPLLLMENAAIVSKEEIFKAYPRAGKFCLVCGPGNNGGDGYALARHLFMAGKNVRVFYISEPSEKCPDALLNFNIAKKLGIQNTRLSDSGSWKKFQSGLRGADVVVDAIFGIGLNKPAADVFGRAIEAINALGRKVVSLDIPSGLEADTGKVLGQAVRCDLCVSFTAAKSGFKKAGRFLGRCVIRQIGVPR